MKIRLHENNWTIFIDEDIKSLSVEDIKEVGRMIVKNMVVVFEKQTMSIYDELKFCKIIGTVQPTLSERSKHISLANGILRVTGKKNDEGKEGLFGHKVALDWHANQPSNKERKPLIWLYGESGVLGSRTSWINNIMSYNDLDEDFKKEINDIEVFCGYQQGTYSDSSFFVDHINYDNPIKLIQTNEEGKTGLFLPFFQIFGFKDKSEEYFRNTLEKLKNHILKEQYVYHHDWNDGDIVISEQWLSIHKRWAFEGMSERILHRIAFNHNNIYAPLR